eukprot:3250804-Rhodomonas_salina.2
MRGFGAWPTTEAHTGATALLCSAKYSGHMPCMHGISTTSAPTSLARNPNETSPHGWHSMCFPRCSRHDVANEGSRRHTARRKPLENKIPDPPAG